ncbi:MAG: PQQ-binding-like beta-propeller repeat protein [Planctomycetota bacterium]|nr:PQQ-binding-like beta-propeller repeat protein [Planctomycetota bacterium]
MVLPVAAAAHSPLCVTDQNVFFSSSPPIPFGRPGIFDFKYCQFTAIDSNTGELIWTSALESVVSSAPLFAFGKIFAVQRIFEVNNGQLSTRVADIAQFDLRTGTPEIIKTIGSAEHEPLIVSDLMIYVTENRANALELFGNKSKWNSRIGIEVMDIEDTFSASPAYLRSALAVVCASSKGRLFALSIEDGSTLWSTNLSSPPLGTIACSHNRVFCLTRDELVCLSAVGEAVWKKTLGIVEINHLALSESGTLFYVRRDHLYACSAQDGKELLRPAFR